VVGESIGRPGFGCPLCWYYNRRFRVVASVPYEDWIREMESGEVILLGGLALRRTMDDRVEVLVEEVGVDGWRPSPIR